MLLIDGSVRRHLVYGLEKIAFRSDAFDLGARLLLHLAVAESERFGNSATGVFAASICESSRSIARSEESGASSVAASVGSPILSAFAFAVKPSMNALPRSWPTTDDPLRSNTTLPRVEHASRPIVRMLQERQHRHEDERNEDHRHERDAAVCHVALNCSGSGEMRGDWIELGLPWGTKPRLILAHPREVSVAISSTLQPPLADSTTATRHDLTSAIAPAA